MRNARRRAGAAAATVGVLVALAGCAAVQPTRLYTLEPAEPPPVEVGRGEAVGVGPIVLPAYLDRPEIVTRAGAHQVRLGDFDKWAQPLLPMFEDLLAERLRRATGAREVVEVPTRGGSEPRHAVEVQVDRFDADETGKVVLDARWRVYRTANDRTVRAGREVVEEQGPPPPDYPGVVAAMGRAVDALARAVAPAIPGSAAAPAG